MGGSKITKLLKDIRPDLRQQFSDTNTVNFDSLGFQSHLKVEWVCLLIPTHRWISTVQNKVNKGGCPICNVHKLRINNTLSQLFPHLQVEYSPSNELPFNVLPAGSGIKAIWACQICTKQWEASIYTRTSQGTGCPWCAHQQCDYPNSLGVTHPHLINEWDPSNEKTPFDVTTFSTYPARWICKCGFKWTAECRSRTAQDSGCPMCSGKRLNPKNSFVLNYPTLAKEFSNKNTIDINSLYAQSHTKVWWECYKGHEWEACVYTRTGKHATGCPQCDASHYTKITQTAEQLVEGEHWDKFIFNKRKELSFRPDIKLSDTIYMNVDGLFWHSQHPSAHPKGIRYHLQLREAFESHNLRLLQFYEDEIRDKPEIVKSMVDAILGKTPHKIYARKTEIREVDALTAINFLDTNHIIGKVTMCSYVGLYHEGQLVQLMVYRQTKDAITIVRSCGLLNTVVTGGFQKLLKYLKDKQPKRIETQIDLRYADGHSLLKAGFTYVNTQINYEYTDGFQRKDKRSFRVPAGTNEELEAAKQGWYRIYNAGRAKYVLECGRMVK